jgi:hypothetical protein
MSDYRELIKELLDTIPATQDMQHTMQGDRQERAADAIEALRAENERLRAAGLALIADVKRRHPGEELRCPFMRGLDEALERKPE